MLQPGSPRSRLDLGVRTFLVALWFGFWFFVAIPGGILWWAGVDLVPPPGLNRLLGALVIGSAHVMLLFPVATFVIQGGGTHAPFDPPIQMVRRGAHRVVRNPMYLLYLAVLLGEAVLYRSWLLLAYAAFFWSLAHLLVVGFEEKDLRRRFGDEFEDYCRRVGRWIPRPPSGRND
jgi:protein-S-isoprenylcysteine O-methyltransferase Ste14